MKKLFVYGCVAVLGSVALASCKKSYTCKFSDSSSAEITYTDLNKTEAEAAETSCKLAGGSWSTK